MSDFGVTLSMHGLRFQSFGFQSFVDVVALPARFLVVDLHIERQREFALREYGIEISRQRLEDVLAGLLAGCEIAAFAEPEHHVEKAEIGISIRDRIMLTPDGADADAAEREDAGFNRCLADDFDGFAHVDKGVEIGGIFDREMRHAWSSSSFLSRSNRSTIPRGKRPGLNSQQKEACPEIINMLNLSDQIQSAHVAAQTQGETGHDRTAAGAQEMIQEVIHDVIEGRGAAFRKRAYAPRSDARILPLAADVAASRPRSRDAAVPSSAAPPRP